jgi:2-amino-4-hydroxy-6-hydroxymethyldihydropteridine diphosphokinase
MMSESGNIGVNQRGGVPEEGLVYVGGGGNIGLVETILGKAIAHLAQNGLNRIRTSSVYTTEPWGVQDQPNFVNIVLEGYTFLEPEQFLALLLETEALFGRNRAMEVHWGPRTLDLDYLLDSRVIQGYSSPTLVLPHPHMLERDFVLEPLTELSPFWRTVFHL